MTQRIKDITVTIGGMIGALLICDLLRLFEHNDVFVSMIFILAVFLISRFTTGYLFGIISSIISVFAVNFIFTYPYFELNFFLPGYPITIACMFAVSIITSTMTTKLMQHEKLRLESEKETMRSNLLRAVSHDLRTPLTSILGASSTMLENLSALSTEEQYKLLSGMKEEAQWLIRMVENLLSVTRIEDDGETKIVKTQEAVEEVIAASVYKFKKRYPELPVEVQVPEELLMVPMDAMLMEQVIINLLENIIHHGVYATKASITVTLGDDQVKIVIQDDGVGFIKQDGTANEIKDQRRNMGLGLSVCRTIIWAHGGTLMTSNAKPHGAIITFTLPR